MLTDLSLTIETYQDQQAMLWGRLVRPTKTVEVTLYAKGCEPEQGHHLLKDGWRRTWRRVQLQVTRC